MKKLLTLFAIAMAGLSAMAQTNFRHISFAEAQKAAQQEKKLIFVDFYTSWCGPCKNMANNVFPQKKVGDFMNEKFVCVKYDAEKEELDLVSKSKITAYPTFVIFNADGTEVNRKVGGASVEGFLADMDRLSNADLTPEKIRARYDAGERSARLVMAYAALLKDEASKSRKDRAEKQKQITTIINDYFASLSEKERLSADNLFLYKEYCEYTADEKMQYLFANRSKAPKALRADIDTLIAKAYELEAGKRAAFFAPFNKETYTLFRQQLMTLDVAKQERCQKSIAVCDAYATGDMNKYIDAVEKVMQTGSEDDNFNYMYAMGDALDKCDKDVKLRAAKFIRNRLTTMSGNYISFIGTVIADLEGTSNRH